MDLHLRLILKMLRAVSSTNATWAWQTRSSSPTTVSSRASAPIEGAVSAWATAAWLDPTVSTYGWCPRFQGYCCWVLLRHPPRQSGSIQGRRSCRRFRDPHRGSRWACWQAARNVPERHVKRELISIWDIIYNNYSCKYVTVIFLFTISRGVWGMVSSE